MGILFDAKYGYSADAPCADSCAGSNPNPDLYSYTYACTDTYTRSDADLSTSRSALGGIGDRG
jgi:hypothetical protein